jgi:hypothetical protein
MISMQAPERRHDPNISPEKGHNPNVYMIQM